MTTAKSFSDAIETANAHLDVLDRLIESTREHIDQHGPTDDCGESPSDELYGLLEEMGEELEGFTAAIDGIHDGGEDEAKRIGGRVEHYISIKQDEIAEARERLDAELDRRGL